MIFHLCPSEGEGYVRADTIPADIRAIINEWVSEKRTSAEFGQPPESRQHFDIWQFQTADRRARSAGAFVWMKVQIQNNLLVVIGYERNFDHNFALKTQETACVIDLSLGLWRVCVKVCVS